MPYRVGHNSYIPKMEGLDIVMVIAIILFARLGLRLISLYVKSKKDQKNNKE